MKKRHRKKSREAENAAVAQAAAALAAEDGAADEAAQDESAPTKASAAEAESEELRAVDEATSEEAVSEGAVSKEALSPLDRLRPGERAALIAALATRIRREAERAEQELVHELAEDLRYAEIEARYGAMKRLSAEFPFLAELGMRDRLIAAYHIDRSLHPTEKTPEEQLTTLLADPAMLSALSARFSELIAEKRGSLPPMAARHGTGTPRADRRPMPRDLREASDAAKKALGFSKNN